MVIPTEKIMDFKSRYKNVVAIVFVLLASVTTASASEEASVDRNQVKAADPESETVFIKNETGYSIVRGKPKQSETQNPAIPPGSKLQSTGNNGLLPVAEAESKFEAEQDEIAIVPVMPVSNNDSAIVPGEARTEYIFTVGKVEPPADGHSGSNYIGLTAGLLKPGKHTVTDRNGATADVSYANGITLSGSAGYYFGNGLRVEGELVYDKTQIDNITILGTTKKVNADLWNIGLFANGYYDVPVSKYVTPYILAGVGLKNIYTSGVSVNGVTIWNQDNDAVFAFQLGFGGGIGITDDIMLDLSYRYSGTSKYNIDQVSTDFTAHNILLGMRYLFN